MMSERHYYNGATQQEEFRLAKDRQGYWCVYNLLTGETRWQYQDHEHGYACALEHYESLLTARREEPVMMNDRILNALSGGALHVNDIAHRLGLSLDERTLMIQTLLLLELAGMVTRLPANRYQVKPD